MQTNSVNALAHHTNPSNPTNTAHRLLPISPPHYPLSTRTKHYQSSHSSFFCAPPAGPELIPPPPAFLIALVPTALGRLFPASAKLSQKSFLLSSIGVLLYAPLEEPSLPSTKRLNPSAAFLAPVCAPLATCAAVILACAARSVSANCVCSKCQLTFLTQEGEIERSRRGNKVPSQQ